MHFWELCLMKNTLFLKKKWRKKPLFHCVFCDFSRFLRNRKKFTSTNFLGIFKVGPCKYMGRSWADHGRSWADHGQIMGRSWAMLGFGGFSQLPAGFWWVFAAYGWVFRLACWVFLPYGWVFRSACWVLLPYGCLLEKKTVFFGWVFLIKTNWVGPDPRF